MKKQKRTIQVISGVLATSLLTASCTQYNLPDEHLYGNLMLDDSELGKIVIPISIQLKPEDVKYVEAVQKVMNNILKSPKIAQDFNKNPKAMLKKYGYDGDVNLDDVVLKLVLALSDTELLNAIKKNDFKTYLNRCMEKGLLKSPKSFTSNEYYKEQMITLYQREDVQKYLAKSNVESPNVIDEFSPVLVAMLVIAIGVVIIAGFAFVLATASKVKTTGPSNCSISEQDLNAIDIYVLKSESKDTYIAVDDEIEEMVDQSIMIVKNAQPNYFDTVSEEETRNLIKINLLNNLN